MVTRNRVLAALAAIACLWGIWYFFPTRTRQVKRRFKTLASSISKDGPEGNLTQLQQAVGAAKFFADPCAFESEYYNLAGSFSSREISGYCFEGRSRMKRLRLKFYDVQIGFPEKDTASVEATVRLTGTTKAGDDVAETHEITCELKKSDGEWRFTRIKLVEVLKK